MRDFIPWTPDAHSNHDQWPRRNWAMKLMLVKRRPKGHGALMRIIAGWRWMRGLAVTNG